MKTKWKVVHLQGCNTTDTTLKENFWFRSKSFWQVSVKTRLLKSHNKHEDIVSCKGVKCLSFKYMNDYPTPIWACWNFGCAQRLQVTATTVYDSRSVQDHRFKVRRLLRVIFEKKAFCAISLAQSLITNSCFIQAYHTFHTCEWRWTVCTDTSTFCRANRTILRSRAHIVQSHRLESARQLWLCIGHRCLCPPTRSCQNSSW